VQFDPTAPGTVLAQLVFEDNAGVGESNLTSTPNGSYFLQSVPLSGTGVASTIATTTTFTTSSTFGGQTLPPGVALVGNPVTVKVTVKPASGTAAPTGTCTLTIATFPSGGITSLTAAYTPAANSGFLSGLPFAATEQVVEGIVPCGAAIGAVTVQQKASVTKTFTVCLAGNLNLGAVPLAVRVLECPQYGVCTVSVTPLGGGVYTVSVTIITYDNGNGTAWLPVRQPRGGPGPWPLTLFAFGVLLTMLMALQLARQNRARPRLLYTAGLLSAMVLSGISGCGGASNQNTTPVGTYTINVTVTAGTFTATVPVNVTVTK
jgi:hypothetical protein